MFFLRAITLITLTHASLAGGTCDWHWQQGMRQRYLPAPTQHGNCLVRTRTVLCCALLRGAIGAIVPPTHARLSTMSSDRTWQSKK